MFSGAKIAADFAGTADNCTVVARSAIPHEASSRFLLNNEIPFVFLKSAKEEHIFTDQAYVSICGNSSVGTKRMVRRLDFFSYPISNVHFETSGVGMTDQDCELKFVMNNNHFSIDIKKAEMEAGIQIYRTLTALSNYQARNLSMLGAIGASMNHRNLHLTVGKDDLTSTLATLNSAAVTDVVNVYNLVIPLSYQHIFMQYLG